ncbi:MAG TPA: hypothetical protein PKK17_05130 [Sphingorhabdus lacus]|jgi:hypothetical protein|uniref:Uncharacterized protein n=1 Tax=Sphingorhabdus lacus TaxID=392610 RepID=A0A6I6L6P4_9SPHN|nr:hypothetical protein [Sphingorhabdus lacus]QGY81940.1 hypothetical protein EUU25_15750 [Sphingorhabdus lacus]HNW17875.1 hypothetical protein [Sphingorhabdus lacus]HPV68917.1 hypothetical protein [Sphingorhabdus lacus]
MLKRKLVCRNEAARHPFRRMLPPPVLDATLAMPQPSRWWRKEDTHLFMLSFSAFFVAISSFIF